MEVPCRETACYRLPAFISLKMELHRRCNLEGKVQNNPPCFQQMAYAQFTQKS